MVKRQDAGELVGTHASKSGGPDRWAREENGGVEHGPGQAAPVLCMVS